MEACDISILPWATRIDIERLYLICALPFLDFLRDKCGAIIVADMFGYPRGSHRLTKGDEDLFGSNLSLNADSHTSAVYSSSIVSHLTVLPLLSRAKYKISGPNVIAVIAFIG